MEIDFSPIEELEFGLSGTASPDVNFGTGDVQGAIDIIKVNGQPLPIVNKTVDVPVPTKTSQLSNDSNFAIKSDIPKKTSQLTNDSGYITSADVPSKTSQLTNDGSDGENPYINATSYANATTNVGGTVRIGASYGTTMSSSGYLAGRVMTREQYDGVGNGAIVGKGTLGNVLSTYSGIVGKDITFAVPANSWTEPSGTNPYKTIAIVTLPDNSFTNNCTIELMINDRFNDFARYGFVLYSAEASSQRIWLTALKKPSSQIYLTVKVYTYGN